MTVLNEAVPPHREYLADVLRLFDTAFGQEWPEQWRRRLGADLRAFDALATAIAEVRGLQDVGQLLGDVGRERSGHKDWHVFASDIAFRFRAFMRRANPGWTLRISNDGPIARYAAAVIPYVTGERPKLDAIARHLQRKDAEARRELDELAAKTGKHKDR